MGNAAGKEYGAVTLAGTTVHTTSGIPVLVASTAPASFGAKKTALTRQSWTFASAPAIVFEHVQRTNPEKYVIKDEAGKTLAILACTNRKLGGTTFGIFAPNPAYEGQEACDAATVAKIKEEEGATLYSFGQIDTNYVASATYSVVTSSGEMKPVYKIKKMGWMKFRAVVESVAEEGVAVAKAEQANLIGSKGKLEVSKGCDLAVVCSLVILLINANQQAGAGAAAGAGAF